MRRLSAFVGLCAVFAVVGGVYGQTTKPATKPAQSAPAAPAAVNKGIGPIKSITLGPVDVAKAGIGQKLFESKCLACHKLDQKLIGPALKGVTTRRSPEWILNMILNPTEMTQKDPLAKEMMAAHNNVPMVPMGLTEEDAKNVLEYLRQVDSAK